MERVYECKVLNNILRNSLHCQLTCSAKSIIPSFRGKSLSPKGCLIAHTILALIETQKVVDYFKTSLYRVIELNKPKGLPNISPDELWNIGLAVPLLHDIGKLTDQYVERSNRGYVYFRHHQLSAIIAYKALSEILHDYNDYIATVAAYAILFHHEALDWRSLESDIFIFNYLTEVFTSTKIIQYTINDDRLKIFNHNLNWMLKQLCKEGILIIDQYNFLFKVLAKALQKLSDNRQTPLRVGRVLNVGKAKKTNVSTPAFFLYRLLYLVDNRAASARSQYWLDLLQKIDWDDMERVADQVYYALTQKCYYIGLSAIPEITS